MHIRRKMFFGYVPLVALLFAVSYYSLRTFDGLLDINDGILHTDVPLIDSADRLIECVLAQELYANRYAVLRKEESRDAFWSWNGEFDAEVEKLRTIRGVDAGRIEEIAKGHERYNSEYAKAFGQLGPRRSWGAKREGEIQSVQRELIDGINGLARMARKEQDGKIALMAEMGFAAYRTLALLSVLGIAISLGAALLFSRSIYGSIDKLRLSTDMISDGRFSEIPSVDGNDELSELSRAFAAMARRLEELEALHLDSSPLTHLPGGVAVENAVKEAIEADRKFAFCVIDLDNFKAYNDHYGYMRGNDVIRLTARAMEDAVRELGSPEDFVGHVGGDDFVLMTTPQSYPAICARIVEVFDRESPGLYDPADRAAGHIHGVNRKGAQEDFPFLTISIAVVTNVAHEITSHIRLGEIATDLKEYAKSQKGSLYVVDRRTSPEGQPPEPGPAS